MTETAIKFGPTIDGESAENAASAICTVIETCYECHADQDTIREAVKGISRALSMDHASVSDCTFVGDKTVNMDSD